MSLADRLVARITRFSAQHALAVLLTSACVALLTWWTASHLRIEGSFVSLLPSDSPTGERFSEAHSRKAGGNSTLIVLASSKERERNRAFVDALAGRLQGLPKSQVHSVETGPGESRSFFLDNQWLFAPRHQLEVMHCVIEREVQKRKPGYLGLEEESCEELVAPPRGRELSEEVFAEPVRQQEDASNDAKGKEAELASREEELSPLEQFDRRLKEQRSKLDRYPTGYFENEEGTVFSVMIRAPSAGMGEFSSDRLFDEVKKHSAELEGQFRDVEVGFAGDIPNAIDQRNALISDMATISLIAVALILGSIVVYFRSFLSLLQIGYCVTVGCGCAFALAMVAYGRLNTATSFLGAIIAGNGINYGIVYLARYRELRISGRERISALVAAAIASRRGTWLAAVAAGGAYAALLSTSFRGFSEFGLIGGVGMVLCWVATFTLLPAVLVMTERVVPAAERRMRATLPLPLGGLGRFVQMRPWLVLGVASAVTLAAAWPLPDYIEDPWEYNFSRLGSESSKKKGAGNWSRKANRVFKSRGSPMLVMADEMEQVLDLEEQFRNQDARIEEKRYIDRIETVYDRLGGAPEVVEEKLRILSEIRSLVDEVSPKLKGEDKRIALEYRPPERLRPLTPDDLPDLARAQFEEKDGTVGTPLYVYLARGISQSNGKNLLDIAAIFENVQLPNGQIAPNASRSTVFAAMIRAMERDGPLATLIALLIVVAVTALVTGNALTSAAVLGSLFCGIVLTVGGAAWFDVRLNFLNFVALPLTFGIGVEYAINIFERIRFEGSIPEGLQSVGGPVALCSLTTILGYGALIFADNMALQSFGRYAMAGEFACILTALFVLPAALSLKPGAWKRVQKSE